MKVLRFILLFGGAILVLWGVTDYLNDTPETSEQAIPKIILGMLAALASLLAKSRR